MQINVSPRESTLILKGDFLRFTYIYIYIYIYTYSAKTQVLQGCSFLKPDSTKQGVAKTLRGRFSPLKRNVFEHADFYLIIPSRETNWPPIWKWLKNLRKITDFLPGTIIDQKPLFFHCFCNKNLLKTPRFIALRF